MFPRDVAGNINHGRNFIASGYRSGQDVQKPASMSSCLHNVWVTPVWNVVYCFSYDFVYVN